MRTMLRNGYATGILVLACQALLVSGSAEAQEAAPSGANDLMFVEQVRPDASAAGIGVLQVTEEPVRTTRTPAPVKKRSSVRRPAPSVGTRNAAAPVRRASPPASTGRSLALDFGRRSPAALSLPSVREGLSSRIGERI